jgi:hypothetical protein
VLGAGAAGVSAGADGAALSAGREDCGATSTGAEATDAGSVVAGFGAAGRAAAGFAAGVGCAAALPAGYRSRSVRTTGGSIVEDAERTNSPSSFSLVMMVLLSTPSSLASS